VSSKQKRKGWVFEDSIKKAFRQAGFKCDRLGQANQPDLLLDGFGFLELKCSKNRFGGIYRDLSDNAGLIIRRQSNKQRGNKPLVVIPLDTFIHLLLVKEVHDDGKIIWTK